MARTMTMLALVLGLATVVPVLGQTAGRQNQAGTVVSMPVNLNTATLAQLEALPGIGRATAERILEYRQKHGGFKKPEDLMNVRGIGEKSFLRLKELVTVTPPRAERNSQP